MRLKILIILLALVILPWKSDAKEMFISDIIVSHDERNLLFYCTLEGLFDRETIGNIYKGVELSIVYEMELVRKREIWFNSSDITIQITRSVKYSPLKKEFLLYEKDLSSWKVTNKLSDAKRWLTEVEFIPIYDYKSLELAENYFITVGARLEGGGGGIFFPFNYLFFVGNNQFETERAFSDSFIIEETVEPEQKPLLQEDRR